jgi:hypothetical protein
MYETDRKNKIITIRLSKDEYDALKSKYDKYGARNLSDLARLAFQKILHGPETQAAQELADLAIRVRQLESQMALILERRPANG